MVRFRYRGNVGRGWDRRSRGGRGGGDAGHIEPGGVQRRPLDARLHGPDGAWVDLPGREPGVVDHFGVEPQDPTELTLLHDDLLALRGDDPVVVGVPLEDVVRRHRHGGDQDDESDHPRRDATRDTEAAPAGAAAFLSLRLVRRSIGGRGRDTGRRAGHRHRGRGTHEELVAARAGLRQRGGLVAEDEAGTRGQRLVLPHRGHHRRCVGRPRLGVGVRLGGRR